jgi:F-type H+-transporting ATPase subunit delta
LRENVLARRYAGALFELAEERGLLKKIHQEVQSFDESICVNLSLGRLLVCQDLTKKEKQRALEKLLQDRVSNVFMNFILLLLKKNREAMFATIAREFGKLVDKHHKRVRALATTAVPLDPQSNAKLKHLLDKAFRADVVIDSHVDDTILGGIIVNVDGQVLDASLKSQLRRLRDQLSQNTN